MLFGSANHDVAERGTGPDLDCLLGGLWATCRPQAVVDTTELGAGVDPGGCPLSDRHIQVAGRSSQDHGSRDDLTDLDVPVGGLGGDLPMCLVDDDVAIRRLDTDRAGHLAHPGLSVEVLDLGIAVDLTQAHVACGGDLGVALGATKTDCPRPTGENQLTSLIDGNVAGAGLDPGVTETAIGPEMGEVGVGLQGRTLGQLDRDVDRARPTGRPYDAAEASRPRRPDLEDAVGEFDDGLLRRFDVRAPRAVSRVHHHNRVGSRPGDEVGMP